MKILRISKQDKQWKLHEQHSDAGEIYTLRRGALKAASEKVKSSAAGDYLQIQIQRANKIYETIWELNKDAFPPELHKRTIK